MKRFLGALVFTVTLAAATASHANHKLHLYVDANADISSSEPASTENVNTRVALGYVFNGRIEAGIESSQNAEDRSVQSLGVFGRFNLSDRDSTDTVVYVRLAINGVLRDISGDVPDSERIRMDAAAGIELKMSPTVGAFFESDIDYLFSVTETNGDGRTVQIGEQIDEFAVHMGAVVYF